MSSILSKLQLYVQEVNSSIEDTSQKILSDLPQIVHEVQQLQGSAVSLKSAISQVEQEIARVQNETGEGLKTIEHLDMVKTKLQNAKQGLQESDSWGAFVSELEDLLERNDIMRACEKLSALQTSLEAQRNLPGQVERSQQVELFKNQLESQASSQATENFTSGNLEESKKMVKIYRDIDRFDSCTFFYR